MVNSNLLSFLLYAQLITLTSCLTVPLPGGRSISYNSKTGVLRIQLEPNAANIPRQPTAGTLPDPKLIQSIAVRDTGIPQKGFGAYATKTLERDVFLGFYEGDLIRSRDTLDDIVRCRGQANGAMDYVMSLDGGVTFLDGYARYVCHKESGFMT